jgi:mono/diheme cytochrome c family protein
MTTGVTRRLIAWVHLFVVCAGTAAAQQSSSVTGPLSPFSRRKAETLLRDHLPCLGCHKLNGDGGTIGPDLGTVRNRRSPAYIAAMITDPQRVVPGSAMPKTRMPDATRDLITRYLAAQPGTAPDAPVPAPPAPAGTSDPAALYAKWCASCHGPSGRGDGPNAPHLPVKPTAHASREVMSARPDDSLYDTIAGGGAIMNRSHRMPAFGATLSSAEIRSLVRHIRALCDCEGPPWSRP